MNLEGIFVEVDMSNIDEVLSLYEQDNSISLKDIIIHNILTNELLDESNPFFTRKTYFGLTGKNDYVVGSVKGCDIIKNGVLTTLTEIKELINKQNNKMEDTKQDEKMRQFSTGATRNLDENKLDFEGFLSPLALEEFAKYMHKNRKQADGQFRDSDNWQKGIPVDAYMKSMWRHFFDTWKNHRGLLTPEDQISNLCGLMFNVQGMLHELIKRQDSRSRYNFKQI